MSKELALLSTPIRDAMQETGQDPTDIDMPNVGKFLDQEIIDILEETLPYLDEVWTIAYITQFGDLSRLELMEAVIALDMRPIISYFMCRYTNVFNKYISVPNVMKSCIEYSNGNPYKILNTIFNGRDRKAYLNAIHMIDDFITAQKYEEFQTLFEVVTFGERRFILYPRTETILVQIIVDDNFETEYNNSETNQVLNPYNFIFTATFLDTKLATMAYHYNGRIYCVYNGAIFRLTQEDNNTWRYAPDPRPPNGQEIFVLTRKFSNHVVWHI